MTEQEIQAYTDKINSFSQYEMCIQWRFGKPEQYPWFDLSSPLYPIWKSRFDKLGGFTPEISKSLGWD